MIISIIKLIPRSNQRDSMMEIFRAVIRLIRGRPGCMDCTIHEEDNNQPSIIYYIEQWESQEALQHHIQSSIYSMILNAMEFASETPEIRFHEVSKTMGLELIEAMRPLGKVTRNSQEKVF